MNKYLLLLRIGSTFNVYCLSFMTLGMANKGMLHQIKDVWRPHLIKMWCRSDTPYLSGEILIVTEINHCHFIISETERPEVGCDFQRQKRVQHISQLECLARLFPVWWQCNWNLVEEISFKLGHKLVVGPWFFWQFCARN